MSLLNAEIDRICDRLERLMDDIDPDKSKALTFRHILDDFIDEMAIYRQVKPDGDWCLDIPRHPDLQPSIIEQMPVKLFFPDAA